MDELNRNLLKIMNIRKMVESKDLRYYRHVKLSVKECNPEVSIVMTSCNRSKQVYYTLKTICGSSKAGKVHIVLVDDSDSDPVLKCKLEEFIFSLHSIDFICINREMKNWANPCVNYNIGFQYIDEGSSKVVIQNGEVCHIGDVLKYVSSISENEYHVFDVKASENFKTNEKIYELENVINIYGVEDLEWLMVKNKNVETSWYQIYSDPRNYHFLVSMTANTFKNIKNFSYDYACNINYDDDDFLMKIKISRINIINVRHDVEKVGGIHLFHNSTIDRCNHVKDNVCLIKTKENYYRKIGEYLELSDSIDEVDVKVRYEFLSKFEWYNKTVVTIMGIRPDFIRMSNVFKKLDNRFNHILIHTGQHYDEKLSLVFFNELNIRKPDYMLNTGVSTSNHFEQLSYLSIEIPKLFKNNHIKPDLIVFLGDSNTAAVSLPLKKEGYKICHIEAGMRSNDKRMLEELNRTVCDHCSDLLFVYHEDYKKQLALENIHENVYVVGNTIVEPLNIFKKNIMRVPKREDMILLDIHRPENFKYADRLRSIFKFANECITRYNVPVKMLYFKRLVEAIKDNNLELGKIEMIDLLPYVEYLDTVYHSKFIVSDSGTGQEEPSMLNTFVVVPRDFTERPQSYENNCSVKLEMNSKVFDKIEGVIRGDIKIDSRWLYSPDGVDTSSLIVNNIVKYLCK